MVMVMVMAEDMVEAVFVVVFAVVVVFVASASLASFGTFVLDVIGLSSLTWSGGGVER